MTTMRDQVAALDAALRASGLDAANLIDRLPLMMWLAGPDGRCQFASKRCTEYTGQDAATLSDTGWSEVFHPDDRQHVMHAWQKAVESSGDLRVQSRLRAADGGYHWFDIRAFALRGTEPGAVKWFGVAVNIDEIFAARRALVANEERLRYALMATHDCVYDWDMRSGQTYRNDTYQLLFGAPPIAPDTEGWWEQRIHPDDRERVFASAKNVTAAGLPKWNDEYRLRRIDGGYATVADRAYLLYDAARKPVRMIGAVTDITERKAVEQSLRDTQARLMTALEGGQMGTWIWDVEKDRLWWDDASYKLWNQTPAAMGEMSLRDLLRLIDPQDVPGIEAVLAEFAATGIANLLEFRLLRADRQQQWIQVRSRVERDDDGKPIRMAGVYLDITERKRVEQSLRDAQASLLSVMEAGGLATWVWDIVRDEISWDDAAYRLWGVQRAGLEKFPISKVGDLIHPDDRERVKHNIEEFFRTGLEVPNEFRALRPDGATQWLLTKGQIERDQEGRPLRMVGVFLDITDRKRSEEAQLRSQKMEALGTLAGGIAHDFNNILLAIGGNAKLAIEDLQSLLPRQHPVQRNLAEVERATDRAADLVRRILAFSRQQEVKHEVTGLRAIVEDALRLLRPTLRMGVDLRTNYADDAPPASVDPIQIHQVVMNLVTNAAHALGEQGGTVNVRLEAHRSKDGSSNELGKLPAGEYVKLSVADTGGGIEPAIIDRIFDPFFTTKQAGKGTGLGLAVVHGVVESHDGVIAVSNLPGGGASFRVYFPAAAATPSETATARRRAAVQSGGERILYVDDEEPLVFLVTNILERLGYRVTGYVDPEQAVRHFRESPEDFDAVVTDLSMFGMNGFELTRRVHAIRPDIPVLLTSGYLRTEDREAAIHCGIRELILKPNTVEELGHAIVRALAATKATM